MKDDISMPYLLLSLEQVPETLQKDEIYIIMVDDLTCLKFRVLKLAATIAAPVPTERVGHVPAVTSSIRQYLFI